MKKVFFALSALVVLATACGKDDEKAVTPTKDNLVGSYKTTKLTMTSNGQTVDITNNDMFTESCERDDIIKLNSTGTYDVVDAGVQCDPTSDDSGTWSLTNSTTLTLDGAPVTIKSFNGKTLEIEESYSGTVFNTILTKQ